VKHLLGFRRIVLLAIRGRRLQLHLWPRGTVASDDRHGHEYAFVSVPLWGSFDDTRWEVVPGEQYTHLQCYSGATMTVRATGVRAGLRVRSRHVRRPLRPYRCRIGEIHSYVPVGDGLHVSLVWAGPRRGMPSDVYRAAADDSG
jgi:hypothetical protein